MFSIQPTSVTMILRSNASRTQRIRITSGPVLPVQTRTDGWSAGPGGTVPVGTNATCDGVTGNKTGMALPLLVDEVASVMAVGV